MVGKYVMGVWLIREGGIYFVAVERLGVIA